MKMAPRRGRLHGGRAAQTTRNDRGATLVEYSLVVALIVVASVGTIQWWQDESEDNFARRTDSAGAPDLPTGATVPSTTVTTSTPTTAAPTTSTVATQVVDVESITPFAGPDGNNDWLARMTVLLHDQSEGNVANAVISATWVKTFQDASTQTVTATCTSQTDGTCVFELQDMEARDNKNYVDHVTFTITSVTRSSPPLSYTLPSPAPSSTASRP
jgi:Flp pilus assembly pilin Flp